MAGSQGAFSFAASANGSHLRPSLPSRTRNLPADVATGPPPPPLLDYSFEAPQQVSYIGGCAKGLTGHPVAPGGMDQECISWRAVRARLEGERALCPVRRLIERGWRKVVSKEQVTDALKTVRGPDLEGNIVELGMVSDVFISDGKVYFSLTVPAERAKELEPLRQAAERVVKGIPGVKGAMVALTADKRPSANAPAARPAPAASHSHGHDHKHDHNHAHGHDHGHSHAPAPAAPRAQKPGVPGITSIIAVASGKGGVGKSTTAVNIALGMKANGLRVGILDADIYGPSMPRLLKISGRPSQIDGKIIKPMENYGIKVMSMGFLVDEETAMIWRGPMVQSALLQMLREVAWGELDVLVVDMPPGTGDAQLTMAQQVPLAGAVIVSTPQDLALIDARKAVTMFRKVEVPLLGVVENMSYFIAPDTGNRYDIFGHGGARAEATRIGVPFLGEIPLTMAIRELSDAGTPVVIADPDGPQALAYKAIAAAVWEQISGKVQRSAPAMVFE